MCAPNHFVHTDFDNVAHAAFFYMVHKCTTIVFTRLQIAKHENRVMHLSRFGSKPNPANTSRVFSLPRSGDPTFLNRCGRSKVPAVPAVAVRQDVRPKSGLNKKKTCTYLRDLVLNRNGSSA